MPPRRYLSLFLSGIILLTLTSSRRSLLADFTEVTRPDPALMQTAFPEKKR